MRLLSVFLSLAALLLPIRACSTDLDCSLNGVCQAAACQCDRPWTGAQCDTMQFRPSVNPAAYGYEGGPFNPTSWGGNVIFDERDGLYHLFVAEMAGAHCGLHVWGSQSQVVHAVSKSIDGPFERESVVIPTQSHNPQAILINSTYYIFHIGGGNSGAFKNCNESEPHNNTSTRVMAEGSVIHYSTSPSGPFLPLPLPPSANYPSCNNPSPYLARNGSLFVACHWSLRQSPSGDPRGPYLPQRPIPTPAPTPPLGRHWEDPFLYQDHRGHWHVLAHTFAMPAYPQFSISGHLFSPDALTWHPSPTEPFNATVHFVSHPTKTFATLERPKLFFDPTTLRPTHLFLGASPALLPCAQCSSQRCSACKQSWKGNTPDQVDLDWDYTLVRPLA